MMNRAPSCTLVFFAVLGVLAACQDTSTITAPAHDPAAGITQRVERRRLGEVQFYCTLGRHAPSTPTGWETRPDTLYFPRAELDEGGRTVRYEYRRSFPDSRPLTAASCVVPYTEAALRRVDRYFSVEKGGGAEQFRARQGMITTQGCVTDGMCVLDPLVVVAPPPEPSDLPPCPGCEAPFPGTSRPGGGDGGGGTGGSGDGSCDQAVDPTCEKPLTSTDIAAIDSALAKKVRSAAAIGDTAAARACQQMLDQFKSSLAGGSVYRGAYDTRHYGATTGGHIHFDPRWLDAAAAGDDVALRQIANTALHEAAHALGFDHPAGATWIGGQDYYSDQPFNLLSPGANSCIAY